MVRKDILGSFFPIPFLLPAYLFFHAVSSDASFHLSSATCLKKREQFTKVSPDHLLKISRNIDEVLYRSAPKVQYMDLNTLEDRVNA